MEMRSRSDLGASIGPHRHTQVAEIYYVMNGQGTVKISGLGVREETAAIRNGDAVPVRSGRLDWSASSHASRRDLLRNERSGHREDIRPGSARRNGRHSQWRCGPGPIWAPRLVRIVTRKSPRSIT